MLRIAVIIPYYNHSEFLPDALESVLKQTRLPDMVRVIDDGSRRVESEFAARLVSKIPGVNYSMLDDNYGPSHARNMGIKEASLRMQHDITICLDADDMIAPGYIEMMEDALDANPRAWVAYPDVQMFGFEQRVMKAPREYNPAALLSRPFIISGAAFRTEMWEEIYRYNGEGWDTTSDKWGWEDYLFWMEGLLGVAKGDPLAAVHAGPDKFWYLYRRFNRRDRSDGKERQLWAYMSGKMRKYYGLTLPEASAHWPER